jgi:hypothetical protein
LLVTPIFAFIIPLLKFKSIQQSIPQEYMVQLPTVFLNPEAVIIQSTTSESTFNLIPILFYVGIMVFSTLFLVRLFKIINLIINNKKINKGSFKLVLLREQRAAFSFFNYIFIHKKLLDNKKLDIIKHETIHCKQLHTLDLLFFEALKIIMWFNPLIYVYQKRITLLHEYISDAEVVKESDKKSYFNTLLAETFNVENISFINQFFKHSLIKKRIVMIAKEKSQKIKQLKYLLLIPLLLAMLVYSSCSDAEKDELLEMEELFERDVTDIEGKYLDLEEGRVFVGKSLAGTVVPYQEYTQKEKDMHTKFGLINKSIFNYLVVIDENGNRINFFKTNDNALKYREQREYNYVEGDDVPFAVVEEVPIFPGCEGTKEELRACLQENITKHVVKNFNADLANDLGLTAGIKRIFVMFKIDKEGNIVEVQARAPHKSLQEEAIRVVESLPKMEPGKQKGLAVGVKYSLPIAFKVTGGGKINDGINNTVRQKTEYQEGDDLPFAIVEDVPVFPGCVGTNEELKECIKDNITKHVNKNFNTNLAKNLGLSAGVKQVFVMFKIDKEGNIVDVKSRAPHPTLEDEAIRVIQSLPKMKPGKFKGKEVGVKYSLPIAFKVN